MISFSLIILFFDNVLKYFSEDSLEFPLPSVEFTTKEYVLLDSKLFNVILWKVTKVSLYSSCSYSSNKSYLTSEVDGSSVCQVIVTEFWVGVEFVIFVITGGVLSSSIHTSVLDLFKLI